MPVMKEFCFYCSVRLGSIIVGTVSIVSEQYTKSKVNESRKFYMSHYLQHNDFVKCLSHEIIDGKCPGNFAFIILLMKFEMAKFKCYLLNLLQNDS